MGGMKFVLGYGGVTVTLYETRSDATEFLHPGERRRWPDLRASLSQACRATSPDAVSDDLFPTASP
jgi:hypothetical protein